MSKVSARISMLVQYIDEYKNISIRYIDGHQVKKSGKLARCMTPKDKDASYIPFIEIYDTSTDFFYDIAMEGDPFGTECIMKLIKEKMVIPRDTEPVFYSVFCLLHEAGHYVDYQNNPDRYNADHIECETNEHTLESAMEYRKRPNEVKADLYALEHLNETIKNLDACLFCSMLQSDKW